ncbi:hypothetical protein RFI_04884, partial [Reticulomyxa filosa]
MFISLELNATQLNDLFCYLKEEFKNKDYKKQILCAKILEIIALNSEDQQLDSVLECLKYDNVQYCCKHIIGDILGQLNKKLTLIFKFWRDTFDESDDCISDSYISKFEIIAIKLNDKQLYDMWRHVTITALEENIKTKTKKKDIKMKLLVFGLLRYNPRIYFNSNDKIDKIDKIDNIINFDAFNKLKFYHDKQ